MLANKNAFFQAAPAAPAVAPPEDVDTLARLFDSLDVTMPPIDHIMTPPPKAPKAAPPPPVLNRAESAKALGIVLGGSLPVLGLALALRLWQFGQQSVYMDEASYIITGRTLLEQGTLYANATQWTFGSLLHPVLAGWLDAQGGLAAARGLSVFFGLVTVLATILLTLGLFKTTPRSREHALADFALGSKPVMASLLAGLVVAVLPPAIATSQFATYDAMASGFFAAGCAAFVWARRERSLAESAGLKRTWAVVGLFALAAIFIFAGFLAKYVVAIYLPVLCLLLIFSGKDRKLGMLSFVLPLVAACVAYYLFFSQDIIKLIQASGLQGLQQGLQSNDFLREYVWNRLDMLLLLLLGYWGLRQCFRDTRPGPAVLLWGGALMMIGLQLFTRADYNYWKHAVYIIVMLAPLVGWLWSDWSWWDEPSDGKAGFIQRWWSKLKGRRVATRQFEAFERNVAGTPLTEKPGSYSLMAVLVVGLVVLSFGTLHGTALKAVSFWPSMTPAIPAIEQLSRNASTVLIDDSATLYYLYRRIPSERVTTPFFINYKGMTGTASSNIEAYKQAVNDQQFSLVILNGGVTPSGKRIWEEVQPLLAKSPAYQLAYRLPLDSQFLDKPHMVEVYRRLSLEQQLDPAKRPSTLLIKNPAPVAPPVAATPAAAPQATTAPATVAPAVRSAAPEPTTLPRPTATPPPPVFRFPASASYDFSKGDEGWGAVLPNNGLEPGMAVAPNDVYKLDGRTSLRFTPQPANRLYSAGVNREGKASKITLYAFIPADKADRPIGMGLYYFDDKWGWHDDGFATKIVPGQWNEISWKLPENQLIKQFGFKVVGYSGAVYINGVTIE